MNMLAQKTEPMAWQPVCRRDDLVAHSGVVARVGDAQIALFYLPDQAEQPVYALDNRDPKSAANIIGRGIVGQICGDLVIAAPLYKQHFRLKDGSCMEFPEQRLRVWPVRLNGDHVEIADSPV
ncbi:nitrite reductase small subunit NirD [Pseudomonas matsuisoli]|uniref:Nitrite reductase small subunit n=1 Tax=Pseudomonas matsuisoli TaxID=1515666 RepID=A0A917PHY5_9PSED|nr:nitrite reductase small subunit NirD [Pseudomonas matsuisoli]GGJ79390.1 nitrite reductase small subunit [Pseudomonas matsuisoli]